MASMTTAATFGEQPALLGGQPTFDALLPICRPTLPPSAQLQAELAEIIESGMLTRGKHLRAFEEQCAAHLGVKHAVAVSSCTTGLMLSYRALELTGEVLVPSFTFMATVSSAVWAGLQPRFVEIDPRTLNIFPRAAEAAITPRTSAIVAVHNFGNPAQVEELEALARRYRLRLIFDAAHGFGALYQGRPVGSGGSCEVFSLSPTKLVVAGEGGIVATNSDELAESVRRGREYGMVPGYNTLHAGINARLSEMHCLVGRHSLGMLTENVARRQLLAAEYRAGLQHLPGIGFQKVLAGNRSSFKDFSITIDKGPFGLSRDALARALAAENIDSRKYYQPPVHRQTAYAGFADANVSLAVTDRVAAAILSLPLWSHLSLEAVRRVCDAIGRIHRSAAALANIEA